MAKPKVIAEILEETGRFFGWIIAALVEDLKKVASVESFETEFRHSRCIRQGQGGGPKTLVESGEVYSVEPGGEVGGHRGGTMVGVEGDRRTSMQHTVGRSMFEL